MLKILTLIIFLSLVMQSVEVFGQVDMASGPVSITSRLKDDRSFYYLDDFGNMVFLSADTYLVLDDPYLELIGNQGKISYILKKGDRIEITENGRYPSVQSQDSVRNLELRFDFEYFIKFEQNAADLMMHQKSLLQKEYVANPGLRDQMYKQQMQAAIHFLKDYHRSHELSDAFFSLHTAVIDYKLRERQNYFGKAQFTESYKDSVVVKQLPVLDNDDFLFLAAYKNLAVGVLSHLWKMSKVSYRQVLADHFKGRTRHYQIMRLLAPAGRGSIAVMGKKEKDKLAAVVLADPLPSRFQQHVKRMNMPVALKEGQVLSAVGEKIDFTMLGDGKLTYIDFWASWCTPCRQQMPASKKLHAQYAQKGINFVYISIDKNQAAWERAMSQIGIAESASFILPDVNASAWGKRYKISAIPRYMLMDRNGNIVNQNAPRPSDPKIKQELNRWISAH